MAALRYIMDMEDDGDPGNDKYSRWSNLSGSARSPNPSSTTTRRDDSPQPNETDPSKSLPRRRGPLSRSPRPTTIEPRTTTTANADKMSPSRSSFFEQRSVDTIGPMDPAGYGAYAHSLSSSSTSAIQPPSRPNLSSRPVAGTPAETSMPVKLTPITRRVSRAKKGVPVHTCDVCKPPKTFTRAEHLRRHQLSHKPATFQCTYPGCGRVFYRQDLLTRHTQRHNENDDAARTDMRGSTSRQPSHPPAERNTPAAGFLPASMPSDNPSMAGEISRNPSYTGNVSSYSSGQRSSISGTAISPSGHSPQHHSTGPSHSHSPDQGYILSTTPNMPPIGYQPSSTDGSHFHGKAYAEAFQPRRSPSFTSYVGLEGLPSLTIPDSDLVGHLCTDSNWPSSASDSPYSTPDRAMIQGCSSPNADVPESTFYFLSPQFSSPQPSVYQPVPEYASYDETSFEFSHPFPVRSPTPTVALPAQEAENLVTIGHSVPEPRALPSRPKASPALFNPYSNAAFLTAQVPSPAALSAIPRYLDVYWKRFDTLFPLVHRRSSEIPADPVLRSAMAALGSQFLTSKEDRINSQTLYDFALQEAGHRTQWNVQVMQAILLCEFYGRFRGSRALSRPSEPFQSLYSRVSNPSPHSSRLVDPLTCYTIQNHPFSLLLSPFRQTRHLCSTSSSQVASPLTLDHYDFSANTSHRHWDEWIIAESYRRLLAACFVLDVHTSMYHEHSTTHPFITPKPSIPVTKPSQRLWAAQDPAKWEAILTSEPTQLDSASGDEEITADLIAKAPPLDMAVYLALETIRLPRRLPASTLDVSAGINLDATKRMCSLFPGSTVANTYLALHHTPLRDLLAVSGDTWLFSRKLLDPGDFLRRQATVRTWSSSAHAGAASTFAAKALIIFFDIHNDKPNSQDPKRKNQQGEEENMSDISDYWAMYVCALVCWSLGHSAARSALVRNGSASSSSTSTSASYLGSTTGEAQREAREWLKTVASLSPEAATQSVRGRRETLGVVTMVRKRLESETAGNKNKLLIDAIRVLKNLEDEPSKRRF
ncbi:hypothetical protein F4861DRAFT_416528 [Xylaria intraflava]|nr:hypothetical protein F4861DRAFT_416528 [Xylaria intraflava]